MADEEEKESNEAEDLFEMDCAEQFSTKNLTNTNTNTGELQKTTSQVEEKHLLPLVTDLCALGEDIHQGKT